MKKTKKAIMLIFINLIILASGTIVFGKVNIDNIKDNQTISGTSEIKNIGSYIYSGIFSLGVVLSVVVLAILGVKYMLGSASERAEYKKTMMPYIIGATLVFSASTIANAIYLLAK